MEPSFADRSDVLIIGAGPVGLALACELQRRQVRVRLVEKKTGPNEHPNAAMVHVRTLEILRAMGAADGFLREGYPLREVHPRVFGQRIGVLRLDGLDSPVDGPRCLGQQVTERLLMERFAQLGGRVQRGIEAVGVAQHEREARVTLRHLTENNREEIATATWVVGCEGSKSVTREAAGIAFEGERYPGKEFLQTECRVRWNYPHGHAYIFLTATHILLFFPYDDKGFYRVICARQDQDPANQKPPTLDEFQALVREVADPCADLHDPTWFNRFRSGHRIAARFREGRLLLAGDAGHVHVPIGGQGMNYGIHDAFNLGWKLAAVIRHEAPAALLESYSAERHPVDQHLVKLTSRAFHLMIGHPAIAGRVMRVVGPTLLAWPGFQQQARELLGEVRVSYPASTLSEDHGGSGGPVAGTRAPDAVVVRLPARKTIQLFDLLQDTRWIALFFAGEHTSERDFRALQQAAGTLAEDHGALVAVYLVVAEKAPALPRTGATFDVLMDRELSAHTAYGAQTAPCVYLIRPDGYVGFRSGLENQAELTRYLKRMFI